MYVKIKNNAVSEFPYSKSKLRNDNPNTSFPKNITGSMLESYGVFHVTTETLPEFNSATQKTETSTQPVFNGSNWILTHSVVDKTQEELDEYNESITSQNRGKRNSLLSNSDWTQAADAPVAATAWATYRQALRDITSHANFPHLTDADWPVKP